MTELNDPEAADAATDYETATARLDEIIARLDSGDAQLRETLALCAEAKTLIEYCATELAAVDQGLKELRLEDLAASLKPTGTSGQPPDSGPATPGPEQSGDPGSAETAAAGLDPATDEQPPPPEEPPF